MADNSPDTPGSRLSLRERRRRRHAARQRRKRRRQLIAIPVVLVLALAAAIALASAKSETAVPRKPALSVPYAKAKPVAVVSGGPLAPARFGGLTALWSPTVATQPGTPAAYAAASRREGLPGYLVIADRGNNRILVVDPQHRLDFEFPNARERAQGKRLFFNDDTFVEPGGAALIANEEDNNDVVEVGLATRSLHRLFGHPGVAGSDATHLHTPDDAYMLPGGTFTVADAYGCRIVFVRQHRIVRQLGTSGVCRHEPPRYLDAVNGDTPLPDGGVLVSEINGSWIDEISKSGHVVFETKVPVGYPSDPQPLPGGRILLADYSEPGHVLIVDRHGRVLWEYGPSSGHGMLNHPSLAMALPNGDIAVNDDYRDRVVVIDPRSKRIVWQYGHTDKPGTARGYLHIPDGMDFVPAGPRGGPDYAAVVHP